jgi:hypothetical protein
MRTEPLPEETVVIEEAQKRVLAGNATFLIRSLLWGFVEGFGFGVPFTGFAWLTFLLLNFPRAGVFAFAYGLPATLVLSLWRSVMYFQRCLEERRAAKRLLAMAKARFGNPDEGS